MERNWSLWSTGVGVSEQDSQALESRNRKLLGVGIVLSLTTLVCFILVLGLTYSKIGEDFPGYLSLQNGIEGVFYLPGWRGPQQEIFPRRSRLPQPGEKPGLVNKFSKYDYALIVLLPSLSGLLFVIMGVGVTLNLPSRPGHLSLLFFLFVVGNYFILSPEVYLCHRFTYPFLVLFAAIPATAFHFALRFPQGNPRTKRNPPVWLPYLASAILLFPLLYYFSHDPQKWLWTETLVLAYLVLSYIFWLIRLAVSLKQPQFEYQRTMARFLLLGHLFAFLIPLGFAIALPFGYLLPLNLVSPLILFFPISLFTAGILGKLKQSQVQLAQSERKGAMTNLLAGLAHEINNPLTFIYSNIQPLREMIQSLKGKTSPQDEETQATFQELDSLVDDMQEGAKRTRTIIDNFRYFSSPQKGQAAAIDLNRVLEQSLVLLSPKWKNRIHIERHYGTIPLIQGSTGDLGQIFVNILANACDAIQDSGRIEISTQATPKGVEVSIRDSGQGISKEKIPFIFDPFYSTKSQGQGTGLGLAISRELIKSHCGTLVVKSVEGKGTEFLITFPANQGEK